jgi:hypothetical protein
MKIVKNWNCYENIKIINQNYVYTILLLGFLAIVESHHHAM